MLLPHLRAYVVRGLPPADLLEEVAAAWEAAGLDVVECMRKAVSVTNDWEYKPGTGPLHTRLERRQIKERRIPVVHRDLQEILRPQPDALTVIQKLLDWIDRVDLASQRGGGRPAFTTLTGDPIFPPKEQEWWMTDVRRNNREQQPGADEDGPVTDVDEVQDETDDEDSESDKASERAEDVRDADVTSGVVAGWEHCQESVPQRGSGREGPRAG